MSAPLTLFLEGTSADTALQELLSLEGLTGAPVAEDAPPHRTDWLSLTANLLQVASAPLLAKEFLAWFRRWREKPGAAPISCVIECPDGSRLNLNAVTEAELATILATILAAISRQSQP